MFDLVAIAAGIMAFLALRQSRRNASLSARVEHLEQVVAGLRTAIAQGGAPRAERGQPPARTETPPEPLPPATAPGSGGPPPERAPQPATPGLPDSLIAAPAAAPPRSAPPPRTPGSGPPRGPRRGLGLPDIDWERWIGVRGAAVLGGVVLALAGVYFFQYSIEHGLIPPWLRVVIGTALGLACIGGAELRARARYPEAANALVGGGIVVLYAAFWASRSLYGLIDTTAAFVLMIAVTGACTALAHRHASLVIAMIGLIGGFATPALLSSGSDRPIALFSYILLLDACLLFMANRRGWPILALLSLVGTLVYQALWIGGRMGADQLGIAIGVLAVFAVAYGYALRNVPSEGRRQWVITQAGGALFPFVFALYLASQGRFEEHLFPVGLLLALLSASAAWIARAHGRPWIGLGAAAAGTGVLAVQILWRRLDAALAWESVGLAVLLAAVFHVFVELDRERPGRGGPAPAALLASMGLLGVLIVAALRAPDVPLWPWLTGWLGLAALALRHGGFAGRGWLQPAAAAGLAAGLWSHRLLHDRTGDASEFAIAIAVVLCLGVALQVVALLRTAATSRLWGERAAATYAVLSLLALACDAVFETAAPAIALGSATLLGFLVLLAGTRMPSGRWTLAATLATAGVHTAWTSASALVPGDPDAGSALVLQLVGAALFTFWPFVAYARLAPERFAWYAAALATPAWFLSLKAIYTALFGEATIGLLPVGLAALALGAAALTSRLRATDDPRRTSNLAWFLAVALGFVTTAIPLQLEKEWITLGWALEGLAATWLWRRLDHPGLKYFAFALFVGVTLRLVANEAVLGYYPRPGLRIVNWLLYTYLVPAAAMVASARILHPLELALARDSEQPLYRFGYPLLANAIGLAAIAVVFVWINLAIADWFATGATLEVSFERMPARDLSTSIAWALYALSLLALGVRGRSGGLRWLSLALILSATAKVFLHDLGELEDLYRVASLLGLAVSLIAISLAYQRYVIRPEAEEKS